LFGLIFLSNGMGSLFNIAYNNLLIAEHYMNAQQREVFASTAIPLYNCVVYPLGISLTVYLLVPLVRCRRRLRAGEDVPLAELERSRRHLVNLPFYQVCINFFGWLPGAVVFPLLICQYGGGYNAEWIWLQFVLSFI